MGNQLTSPSKAWIELREEYQQFVQRKNITYDYEAETGLFEDWACVIDVVTSKNGSKYYVIGEVNSCRVFFLLHDPTEPIYEALRPGKVVKTKKNRILEISSFNYDIPKDTNCMGRRRLPGFISNFIFNENLDECNYFIGKDPIDTIINGIREPRGNEKSINECFSNRKLPCTLQPNMVYRRNVVPRLTCDPNNRVEQFYAREDLTFVWMPRQILGYWFGDLEKIAPKVTWKIPRHPITTWDHPDIVPANSTLRGCFIDTNTIYLGSSMHTLAFYVGFPFADIHARIGQDLTASVFFDEYLQRYVVFKVELHVPPFVLLPDEDDTGIFRSRVDKKAERRVGRFWCHCYMFGYIFDRYACIPLNVHSEADISIKVIRNANPYSLTSLEAVPDPDNGLPAKHLLDKISGTAIIATAEYLYCSDHETVLIWHNKEDFKSLIGHFVKFKAYRNDALNRYEMGSFRLQSDIKPIPHEMFVNKPCFRCKVVMKRSFYYNDLFRVIGTKAFRRVTKNISYLYVFFIGDQLDAQTNFAECEQPSYPEDDYYSLDDYDF